MTAIPPCLRRTAPETFTRNLTAIVALAGAGAATAAVSVVTLNQLKDRLISASLHGELFGVAGLVASLDWMDGILGLLAAAAVAMLFWLEIRHRAFSRLLATLTDRQALAVLTIVVGWFGHSYLGTGVLLGGDIATYISRFLEVQRGLDAGRLSQWTNYQYAGAPLLWFTGPLTFVVGGAISFVVRDAMLAAKLLLFTLHVLSGWLYFAFLRRLGIRTVAAMIAAAAFAGCFAHLHLFLYRGVVPQAFTILFLVLLFHSADGLLRAKGSRSFNFLVFSFATAAIIVNHQPHAMFAAAYLGLFGLFALRLGFWKWRPVPTLLLGGLLGALTAAVAVIPVLMEADWVMIEPGEAMFGLRLPTASQLLNLVLWRDTRTNWGVDSWAYLGIGLTVFGVIGIAASVGGRLREGVDGFALSACACLSVCFVLHSVNVRDVVFLLFFVALLAAVGLDWMLDRPMLARRGLLAATLVVMLDLASTSIQPVMRNDKDFFVRAGEFLERTAPNERVMQLSVAANAGLDADMGPDASPMSYYATVQRTAGNHNMAASRGHNFLGSLAKRIEADLQGSGVLAPSSRALLAMLNVGRVICNTPLVIGCPTSFADAAENTALGRFIPVEATPALFSRYLTALALPPGLDKPMLWPEYFGAVGHQPQVAAIAAALEGFLAAEQIDWASRTARAIAVRDVGTMAGAAFSDDPWHPRVTAYEVGLDRVRLQVTADAPGYVQLAHFWFPSTSVTVNGIDTQPLRGTIGLMVVPIQAGASVIELQDRWTVVRRLSAFASGVGLILTLATAASFAWQHRTRRPASWVLATPK